eukprot:SAG11_NODE_2158_length_3731_cov_3.221641_1_plen_80_part_00
MEMEGLMKVDGGFLMYALAYNSIEQLISMAGGSGTEEERKLHRTPPALVLPRCRNILSLTPCPVAAAAGSALRSWPRRS